MIGNLIVGGLLVIGIVAALRSQHWPASGKLAMMLALVPLGGYALALVFC